MVTQTETLPGYLVNGKWDGSGYGTIDRLPQGQPAEVIAEREICCKTNKNKENHHIKQNNLLLKSITDRIPTLPQRRLGCQVAGLTVGSPISAASEIAAAVYWHSSYTQVVGFPFILGSGRKF